MPCDDPAHRQANEQVEAIRAELAKRKRWGHAEANDIVSLAIIEHIVNGEAS